MNDHTTKSLRASVISTLARLKAEVAGTPDRIADYRQAFAEQIDELLASVEIDETGWHQSKGKIFYDIYLLMREEEGTITNTDLTRAGLKSIDFADPVEFHKHCVRVGDARNAPAPELGPPKVCTSCGEEKPANKFKHRGGAKCNACRGKEYRERKNAS